MLRLKDMDDFEEDFVDILDEEGNKTGETDALSHVHEVGRWHRAVHVWILDTKGKLLLQKRSQRMELFPGAWDLSVGAHVSKGETPIETAIREVKEELGIDVPKDDFKFLFLLKNQDDNLSNGLKNDEFNDVYLVRLSREYAFNLQEKEVSAIEFFSLDEFEQMIDMDRSHFAPPRAECKKILEILRSFQG